MGIDPNILEARNENFVAIEALYFRLRIRLLPEHFSVVVDAREVHLLGPDFLHGDESYGYKSSKIHPSWPRGSFGDVESKGKSFVGQAIVVQ